MTGMDLDNERLRIKYAALLADVSGSAVSITDAGLFLEENLERIGRSVGASRVYFAVASGEEPLAPAFVAGEEALAGDRWSAVYAWQARGVAPQSRIVRNAPVREDWLTGEMRSGRALSLSDALSVPDPCLQEMLRRDGVASFMIIPLREDGRLTGVFGIDMAVRVVWPNSVTALFMAIAHTLKIVYSKAALRDSIVRQQRLVDEMLNAMPGMVLMIDPLSRDILFANEAALRRYGKAIVGQKDYAALENRAAPDPGSATPGSCGRDGEEQPTVTRTIHSPVLNSTLQITDRRVSLPDGRDVLFSYQTDVTDLIQARMEKARAEQEAEAKTDFLARMSHEIRTPMNAIIGFTHLLGQTDLDPSQQDYLNKTRIAANGLLHIINDILDFSRIEAGRMEVDSAPFRLSVLLAAVQSIIGFNAKEKNLDFVLDVGPDVPDVLWGDAGRINQVLLNLLSNAVKFTSQGGITLSVRLLERQGRCLHLEWGVRDTGMGMDAAQTARLFQPFAQADGSVARNFGGTGLGLAISKRLVELMGGTIRVESARGKGSAFLFTLGLEAGSETEDKARLRDGLDSGQVSELAGRLERIKGSRILVVDDNAINREIARELLEAAGMVVVEAEGGEESVNKVRSEAFDLVFMDMLMPGVDGLEATRRIREQSFNLPRIAGLPIVAMTANVMAADRERCFESGMNDHIAKPLVPTELMYCLLHWIPPHTREA